MKFKKIQVLWLLLLLFGNAQAQDERIEQEFKKIRAAYEQLEQLSYNIQYLYAKESVPGVYIDTVNGSYKLNGKRYWGMLDSVQYIQNDSFFIALYPEEKVVLLNSAVPAWMQTNMQWDSLWKQQKEKLKVSLEETGGQIRIEMNYLQDSAYKKIELWYNSKSKLMEKMVYVMRQPEGMEEDMNDEEETVAKNEFVTIEVRFTNYSTAPFDKSVLDLQQYIQKKEKEYRPSDRYGDYTVLVGSPGLMKAPAP